MGIRYRCARRNLHDAVKDASDGQQYVHIVYGVYARNNAAIGANKVSV